MAIVTLSDYKSYLNIGDTGLDTFLTSLQTDVEKKVKEYLNDNLESATYTGELFDGDSTRIIVPKYSPITSVTSISAYDGRSGGSDVWTALVQDTDYDRLLVYDSYIYLDGYTFTEGTANYKMTYVAGYSSTTMPGAIVEACKELLALYLAKSKKGEFRLGLLSKVKNSGAGGDTLSYDVNSEEKILKRISYFRRLST